MVGLKSVEKPCGCKESCGHYAWLEDPRDKDYLEEDLTVKDMDLRKESPDKDTYKHKLFMEGKCIKCKEKIVSIPDSVTSITNAFTLLTGTNSICLINPSNFGANTIPAQSRSPDNSEPASLNISSTFLD